jgi:hypothetical protein
MGLHNQPRGCPAIHVFVQAPIHRWQSWDYSDPVYEIDRHPVCRSHSRKLSDLGAVQVRSRAAGTATATVAAGVTLRCAQQ